ncbi:phosphate acetyltransferase [Compostibacter hankyongensis]|uniref:Phosphate acetyltransferase n=1 Tax=Compostibacter hankyongensis TaxID=1007089 RepID=A0ABP8G5Z8_9BACT
MGKGIYITTTEPYSGKSIVSLGLMHVLLGETKTVGFFRPVIPDIPGEEKDNNIAAVLRYFEVPLPYEDTWAFTGSEVIMLKNQGRTHEIIDRIIEKYKRIEEQFDYMLVEGSDFLGESVAFEFDLNASIARNLGLPVVIVENAALKTVPQVVANMQLAFDSFKDRDIPVLLAVANKADPASLPELTRRLQEGLGQQTVAAAIPLLQRLNSPTLGEIATALNARLLFGKDKLQNQADHYLVGAMQLRHYLTLLSENCLCITPGDRADVILGTMQAQASVNYPAVAGMILTGGLMPEEPVLNLLEGLKDLFPVMLTGYNTFEVANLVGDLPSRILPENSPKIELCISTFEKHTDLDRLGKGLHTSWSAGITPRMFQHMLVKKARRRLQHIVLPEGNDDRILTAAVRLAAQDIARITLLGDPAAAEAAFQRLGLEYDGEKIRILDPATAAQNEAYAHTLYTLRKEKNVTLEMARDLLTDVSYFGTMMVYAGDADGMVSGAVHTTQATIRPALQIIKTKPEASLVSSVFFMCLPDRVAVFGDCAVNPNPDAAQLAEIAITSADTAAAFGITPKVAMLSYSSGDSGKGAEVEKVRQAAALVKTKRPDLPVAGPIQYDAAVDITVGQSKLPGSPVAGQASVLIFPDLNTGNNTYKAVQRETGALAIGPMLQGLNKPINDLSRGCTVDDVFNTVVITAIQAQGIS